MSNSFLAFLILWEAENSLVIYPEKGYTSFMYETIIKKKVRKTLTSLPKWVQKKFALLVLDLNSKGPKQPNWQNYSKLKNNEYHCHLGSSWVACWKHEKDQIIIEVYYVGSRENAPY